MTAGLQWRVYRADLDRTIGREQAGERPALVIQAEPLNERCDVVAVVPPTSMKSGGPARLGACCGVVRDPQLRADIAAAIEDCLDLPYL